MGFLKETCDAQQKEILFFQLLEFKIRQFRTCFGPNTLAHKVETGLIYRARIKHE